MAGSHAPDDTPRPAGNTHAAALLARVAGAPPAERPQFRRAAAAAFDADPSRYTPSHAIAAARLFTELGNPARAEALIARLAEDAAQHVRALALDSLRLVRAEFYAESLARCQAILALEPEHAAARYQIRTLAALGGAAGTSGEPGGRILVGVGSGVGNIVHASPLLRRLAQHFGFAVDVVVAEEAEGRCFLLRRGGVAERVEGLSAEVLARGSRLVFLTHSFGAARPRFNAGVVVSARDLGGFDPAGTFHEARWNLECARVLLGVPYEPADAARHYLGELERAPPEAGLIGLIAGSKGGFWAAKRWPGFAELAARLRARGLRTTSFGAPDEHVPGTENRTGGSLRAMAEGLATCALVVGNDSGGTNMAGALGLPVVTVFGPTNPVTRGPLGAHARAVTPPDHVACETTREGRAQLRAGLSRSIEAVTVDAVEAAVIAGLGDADQSQKPAKGV